LNHRTTDALLRLDGTGTGLRPEERAHLRSPEQLPDGSWRLDAVLARGGEVKTYDWGQEVAPWEELSSPATLDSLAGAPVTSDHPWRDGGTVNPQNAAKHAVPGARVLRADAVEQGRFVRASLVLPHLPTTQGLSVGWLPPQIDRTTTPPSQRALRANHVALTQNPRVPGAGVRLDDHPKKEAPMATAKIRIGAVEYDVEPHVAQAIEAERAAAKPRQDSLEGEVKSLKAERDTLKGEVEALKAQRLDAKDLHAEAQRLAQTLERAKAILPEAEHKRLDGLSVAEIKRVAVKHAIPTLDEKASADTVEGAWLALPQPHKAAPRQDGQPRAVDVIDNRPAAPAPGAARNDAEQPLTMAQINAKLRSGAPLSGGK